MTKDHFLRVPASMPGHQGEVPPSYTERPQPSPCTRPLPTHTHTEADPVHGHLLCTLHFPAQPMAQDTGSKTQKFTEKRGQQSPFMGEDGPQVSSFLPLGSSLTFKEGPLAVGGRDK